ncbi:phostensin-like [Narcine bancroftii]|uniref:phostensin-like n=1 Tax=Narcine bancroftii TaxID=1343680 RepID=UPI0038322B52
MDPIPIWKAQLLERRRREEEEGRRKEEEALQKLAKIPAWQQELMERRKSRPRPRPQQNARLLQAPRPQQAKEPDSGSALSPEPEPPDGAVLQENISPINCNPFVRQEQWRRQAEQGARLGPRATWARDGPLQGPKGPPRPRAWHDSVPRLHDTDPSLTRSAEDLSSLGKAEGEARPGRVSRLLSRFGQQRGLASRSRSTDTILRCRPKDGPSPAQPDKRGASSSSSHSFQAPPGARAYPAPQQDESPEPESPPALGPWDSAGLSYVEAQSPGSRQGPRFREGLSLGPWEGQGSEDIRLGSWRGPSSREELGTEPALPQDPSLEPPSCCCPGDMAQAPEPSQLGGQAQAMGPLWEPGPCLESGPWAQAPEPCQDLGSQGQAPGPCLEPEPCQVPRPHGEPETSLDPGDQAPRPYGEPEPRQAPRPRGEPEASLVPGDLAPRAQGPCLEPGGRAYHPSPPAGGRASCSCAEQPQGRGPAVRAGKRQEAEAGPRASMSGLQEAGGRWRGLRPGRGPPGRAGRTITITPRRAAAGARGQASGDVPQAPPVPAPAPAPGARRYPTAEQILVIGGYRSLRRSCLVKEGGDRRKLNISFNDGELESTFEYPSELALLAEFGPDEDETPLPARSPEEIEEEEEEDDEMGASAIGRSIRGKPLLVDESCR